MTIRTQAMDSQRLHPHLSDDDLHALVDAHIPAHDRAALEARLALDPSAQATVAQWQQQRQMLRGLHDRVMEEPIPSSLLATAQQAAMPLAFFSLLARVGSQTRHGNPNMQRV
jgi:anti-sigma factor RsiW